MTLMAQPTWAEVVNREALEARVRALELGGGVGPGVNVATEAEMVAEIAARQSADIALQARMTAAEGRLTADEAAIAAGGGGSVTALQAQQIADEAALTALTGRVTTAEGGITSNNSAIADLQARVAYLETHTAGVTSVLKSPNPGMSTFKVSTDDDDAILDRFITYINGQTFHGITACYDDARWWQYNRPHATPQGLSLGSLIGDKPLDQARSSMPIPFGIKLRMPHPSSDPNRVSGWLQLSGATSFTVSLGGMSLDMDAHSRLFELETGTVVWLLDLHNIAAQNGMALLGTEATAQPVDFMRWAGSMSLNNWQECMFHVGGSDSFFYFGGANFDTTTSLLGPTKFMMMFTSMSKSVVTGLYVTAEGHSFVNIDGNGKDLEFRDFKTEGRNNTHPTAGALWRISGSATASISGGWISFGMYNAALTGRNDGGLIHCAGSSVLSVSDIETEQAIIGNGPTAPFAYVENTAHLIVRNIRPKTSAGGYTAGQKPVVVVKQSTGASVDADNSVTVQLI